MGLGLGLRSRVDAQLIALAVDLEQRHLLETQLPDQRGERAHRTCALHARAAARSLLPPALRPPLLLPILLLLVVVVVVIVKGGGGGGGGTAAGTASGRSDVRLQG